MTTAGPVGASSRAGSLETAVAALRRLAVERSTGALEFSSPAPVPTAGRRADRARQPTGPGGSTGRIYLVDGDVTYAEATTVPGIDVRLLHTGMVPTSRSRSLTRVLDDWDALVDLTQADAELERLVGSATADATTSLLGAATRARCRFRLGLRRWAGRAGRTTVDDLLDQAATGLRTLAGSRIGPDDTVALAPAGHDGVVLPPSLMPILVGLGEGRTPRQAAWQSGLAVLDTVTTLSALADQGACAVITRGPRPDLPPSPHPPDRLSVRKPPPPPPSSSPPAGSDRPPLPCRRRPQTVRPRPGHEPTVAMTDPTILTRLIEGLRRE